MRERDFVSSVLKDINTKFSNATYVYEYIHDTHMIFVSGIGASERKKFVEFNADVVGDFFENQFQSLILLSLDEKLVKPVRPTQFSVQGEQVATSQVFDKTDTPQDDSYLTAA